jgi:hypothetical protein
MAYITATLVQKDPPLVYFGWQKSDGTSAWRD